MLPFGNRLLFKYFTSDIRAGPVWHGPVWTSTGQYRNIFVNSAPVTWWERTVSQKQMGRKEVVKLLRDPVDCSLPGSSIHGILQARILEWVAISFSRGSSPPRDRTQVSCIAGRRFTLWATRKAHPSEKGLAVKPESLWTSVWLFTPNS